MEEPGVSKLVRSAYSMLNLVSFFTIGAKEIRAWTIQKGWRAPQAAGVIPIDVDEIRHREGGGQDAKVSRQYIAFSVVAQRTQAQVGFLERLVLVDSQQERLGLLRDEQGADDIRGTQAKERVAPRLPAALWDKSKKGAPPAEKLISRPTFLTFEQMVPAPRLTSRPRLVCSSFMVKPETKAPVR